MLVSFGALFMSSKGLNRQSMNWVVEGSHLYIFRWARKRVQQNVLFGLKNTDNRTDKYHWVDVSLPVGTVCTTFVWENRSDVRGIYHSLCGRDPCTNLVGNNHHGCHLTLTVARTLGALWLLTPHCMSYPREQKQNVIVGTTSANYPWCWSPSGPRRCFEAWTSGL